MNKSRWRKYTTNSKQVNGDKPLTATGKINRGSNWESKNRRDSQQPPVTVSLVSTRRGTAGCGWSSAFSSSGKCKCQQQGFERLRGRKTCMNSPPDPSEPHPRTGRPTEQKCKGME